VRLEILPARFAFSAIQRGGLDLLDEYAVHFLGMKAFRFSRVEAYNKREVFLEEVKDLSSRDTACPTTCMGSLCPLLDRPRPTQPSSARFAVFGDVADGKRKTSVPPSVSSGLRLYLQGNSVPFFPPSVQLQIRAPSAAP